MWCAAVQSTPGRVHQVAVGLDRHRQPAVPAVRERAADRRRRAVADAAAAGMAEPLIRLVEVPQPARPAAAVAVVARDERPVLVLDLRPELGAQPRRADRARIPGVAGRHARALCRRAARLGQLRAALLEHAPPIAGRQALDRLDQRRQRRLAVGGNRQVDLLHPPEVLVVGADVEIAGRDRDQLRASVFATRRVERCS